MENYIENCEMSSYLYKLKSLNIQYIKFANLCIDDKNKCLKNIYFKIKNIDWLLIQNK